MAAPADSSTSTNQLEGFFKDIFEDKVENLVPNWAYIRQKAKFREKKRTGELYSQTVIVQRSHGFTYAEKGAGCFDLKDPIPMKTKEAQVCGVNMVGRMCIPYEVAAKAKTTRQAFAEAVGFILKEHTDSAFHRLEGQYMYGGDGMAAVDNTSDVTAAETPALPGTQLALEITKGDWSTGYWAGMDNNLIEFYDSTDTQIGTDAFRVVRIDIKARKVIVEECTTGEAAILAAAIAGLPAFDANEDTRDDQLHIYECGAFGKEMTGLWKIVGNTGELFGIDASQYHLWRGQSVNVGGTDLTFQNVLDGQACANALGFMGESCLFVSPFAWNKLNDDLAGARELDQSYSSQMIENGTKAIKYHGNAGTIEVISNPMMKLGDALMIPYGHVKRIGATDLTFRNPGYNNNNFFRELENKAGFELRCYSNQAIFMDHPSYGVRFTNINTTLA